MPDSHNYPSLDPLVEPEVGFSPFRLFDDLRPMRSLLRLAGFIRLGLAYLGRRTKEAPGL